MKTCEPTIRLIDLQVKLAEPSAAAQEQRQGEKVALLL